ncbi:MAG: caspase family protein [Alphaproteobacteria bacterium]|nr:caspase family protein [Alphaproteobacteria bacterium]
MTGMAVHDAPSTVEANPSLLLKALAFCFLLFAIGANAFASDITVKPILAHNEGVAYMEIPGNADRIFTADGYGLVKVSSLQTGNLLFEIRAVSSELYAFAVSPDGEYFATANPEGESIWKVGKGEAVGTLHGDSGSQSMLFSQDGKTLYSGDNDGTIRLWNVQTQTIDFEFNAHSEATAISGLALSEETNQLISVGWDGVLNMWDTRDFSLLSSQTIDDNPVGDDQDYLKYATFVDVSPDGRYVLAGNQRDYVAMWNLETRQKTREFKGRQARFAGRDAIAIIDTDGEAHLVSLSGDRDTAKETIGTDAQAVAAQRSGNLVAVGTNSGVAHILELKNLQTVSSVGRKSDFPDGIAKLDESTFALLFNGRIEIRNVIGNTSARNMVEAFPGSASSAKFAGEAGLIASFRAGPVVRWDTDTGMITNEVKIADRRMADGDGAENFEHLPHISPDNSVFAVNMRTGVEIRDSRTGDLRMRFEMPDRHRVMNLAWAPDGRRFATISADVVGADAGILIWNVDRSGGPAASLTGGGFLGHVEFSKNGEDLFVGQTLGNTVWRWSLPDNKVDTVFDPADQGHLQDMKLVSGGRHLLVSLDKTVHMLDLETGDVMRSFHGATDDVISLAAFEEHEIVMGVSYDSTVRFWSIESGELLATYVSGGKASEPDTWEWLMITPEGFFTGSKNGHSLLSIVRGLDVYSVDQFFDALYDPELVREKLAGDPENKVLKAAEELDIEKILETGAAPRIKILSPRDTTDAVGNTVRVEVEVKDNGGGIGRIEFFVNGVNKGNLLGGAQETVVKTKKLDLASEINTITVIAYNRRNLIASRPSSITINADAAIIANQPTLHVLAVGVEDYADSKYRLNYAADDVHSLSRAFDAMRRNDTQYRDVHFHPLLNADVTRENLEARFNALGQTVKAHDVFMFFVSGHGTAIGRKYFFIPPDFDVGDRELIDAIIEDGISQDDWRDWLGGIKAERSLLIYDTCEAGDLTEILGRNFGDDNVAAERLSRATGRALLTASGPSALALEGYRSQGLLTYALLEGLAVADQDNNGVGLRELFDHVGHRVPQLSEAITTGNTRFVKPYIQRPRRLMRGDDFTLASVPVTGIVKTENDVEAEPVAAVPTHITTGPTALHVKPDADSDIVEILRPFTGVNIASETGTWVTVFRNGRKLGYTTIEKLQRIQ